MSLVGVKLFSSLTFVSKLKLGHQMAWWVPIPQLLDTRPAICHWFRYSTIRLESTFFLSPGDLMINRVQSAPAPNLEASISSKMSWFPEVIA